LLLAKLDPLALNIIRQMTDTWAKLRKVLTNDKGDHGGSISSGGFQAFDQLLYLPDLDVLFSLVGLGVTHVGGW
jgi:hypothetical protein